MKKILALCTAVSLMMTFMITLVACGKKDVDVSFTGISANGTSGTVTTDEITLTFDKDVTNLAASNITVTGATKGALAGTGTTRTLAISDITVENGENITVAVSNPSGFKITPASKTVAVYVETAVVEPMFASLEEFLAALSDPDAKYTAILQADFEWDDTVYGSGTGTDYFEFMVNGNLSYVLNELSRSDGSSSYAEEYFEITGTDEMTVWSRSDAEEWWGIWMESYALNSALDWGYEWWYDEIEDMILNYSFTPSSGNVYTLDSPYVACDEGDDDEWWYDEFTCAITINGNVVTIDLVYSSSYENSLIPAVSTSLETWTMTFTFGGDVVINMPEPKTCIEAVLDEGSFIHEADFSEPQHVVFGNAIFAYSVTLEEEGVLSVTSLDGRLIRVYSDPWAYYELFSGMGTASDSVDAGTYYIVVFESMGGPVTDTITISFVAD